MGFITLQAKIGSVCMSVHKVFMAIGLIKHAYKFALMEHLDKIQQTLVFKDALSYLMLITFNTYVLIFVQA